MTLVYVVVGIFVVFVGLAAWFGRGSGRRGGDDSSNWDAGSGSDGGHGHHGSGCSSSGCSGGCGGGGGD
jgi:hypothetical protein